MKSIGVASVVDANEDSTTLSSAVRERDASAVCMFGLQGLQLELLDLGNGLVFRLGPVRLVVSLGRGLGLDLSLVVLLLDNGLDCSDGSSRQGLLLRHQIVRGLGRELTIERERNVDTV